MVRAGEVTDWIVFDWAHDALLRSHDWRLLHSLPEAVLVFHTRNCVGLNHVVVHEADRFPGGMASDNGIHGVG